MPEEPERKFRTVDKSYFDDAVFIGDSRMVGMSDYSGLDQSTYYAEVGLTIYSLFEKPVAKLSNGSMGTIEQALQEKQFGKVYLMVGINELGTVVHKNVFYKHTAQRWNGYSNYNQMLLYFCKALCMSQKNAHKMMPISTTKIFNKENKNIATLADNRNIFYIDVNEVYADGKGNLSKEYTFDNVHLKGACYGQWVTFLMEHGIVK